LNESERDTLLQIIRPTPYDFRIADGFRIADSNGKFFCLARRCWIILSRVVLQSICFRDAEDLLNDELRLRDSTQEIALERKVREHIVTATNHALLAAKSVWRLSAKGEHFSMRQPCSMTFPYKNPTK